jgi:crotonobetainyl-CoA:carnitine CoA-transferase CaiB-like acyl-CoA transferase
MAAAAPVPPAPESTATAYAEALLRGLALVPARPPAAAREHPAITWADCGLMALTGTAEGPPRMCPVPLASCADGALAALASLAPPGALAGLRGSGLLAERAAMLGLRRAGAVSPGGACRLYQAADGGIALNLAREEDREALPAWLEAAEPLDPARLPQLIGTRKADELVERGRLLGLAIAADRMPASTPPPWFTVTAVGNSRQAEPARAPRVLELASLWAGPLCGHLLYALGAEVIKIESPQRPDGARQGHAGFFDLLNAGKRSVALDLRERAGRERLLALIASADIVIEGSRPRALRQLGIEAETLLRQRPGLTWLALSGHGRGEPREQWVAYGDDAAVAAGLSAVQYAACGEHLIVGDAIADPLTGIHAALAAWASWRSGGGRLVALALRDVLAHGLAFDLPAAPDALQARQAQWTALALGHGVREPRPRQPAGAARPLGADTLAVLAELDRPC